MVKKINEKKTTIQLIVFFFNSWHFYRTFKSNFFLYRYFSNLIGIVFPEHVKRALRSQINIIFLILDFSFSIFLEMPSHKGAEMLSCFFANCTVSNNFIKSRLIVIEIKTWTHAEDGSFWSCCKHSWN